MDVWPMLNPPPPQAGMHWKGRGLRGDPRSGWIGGWRRLPKRLGAVTNAIEAGTWRQGDVAGQRLGALEEGGGGFPPFQCIPAPPPSPHHRHPLPGSTTRHGTRTGSVLAGTCGVSADHRAPTWCAGFSMSLLTAPRRALGSRGPCTVAPRTPCNSAHGCATPHVVPDGPQAKPVRFPRFSESILPPKYLKTGGVYPFVCNVLNATAGGGGQHSPNTPTTGLRERGNDTSRSTGRSGRQNAATRRNMRREDWVTLQGPVKKQQPEGMSHRGGLGKERSPALCTGFSLHDSHRPREAE